MRSRYYIMLVIGTALLISMASHYYVTYDILRSLAHFMRYIGASSRIAAHSYVRTYLAVDLAQAGLQRKMMVLLAGMCQAVRASMSAARASWFIQTLHSCVTS